MCGDMMLWCVQQHTLTHCEKQIGSNQASIRRGLGGVIDAGITVTQRGNLGNRVRG